VPRLLHISNIVFENVLLLVVFAPPCCEILVTGLHGNSKENKITWKNIDIIRGGSRKRMLDDAQLRRSL